MKIVKLKGGLGNQMFQYAFAKQIEQLTGEKVKLDYSAFSSLKGDVVRVPRLAKFSLSLETAQNDEIDSICFFGHRSNSQSFGYRLGIFAEKTFNKRYFWEPTRAALNPTEIMHYDFFDGYWQCYRYVDAVAGELKRDFVPLKPVSQKTKETQKKMSAENAVFVGVRRGDYAAEADHYGAFSEQYYLSAMDKIESAVDNPVFYIFSNDIKWCKTGINWGNRCVIFREKADQVDDFEELILMASCKHAIMVNSTYHWWGAYLIQNPGKMVICPEKWFFDDTPIDIVPPSWIRQADK